MRPILGAVAWPFVLEVGTEAYVFGQKAGLWTSVALDAYRVSAGYFHPEDDSSEDYVIAFMVRTVRVDLRGNWRRLVLALVCDCVVTELGADDEAGE